MIKTIIGLGNPNMTHTIHNAGFDFLNLLSNEWNKKKNCLISKYTINNVDIKLVKPMKYINLSGDAMKEIGIENPFIVVHDDIELSFGKYKISCGTSHKGHNGIKNIINHYGNEFYRIRIGFGRPNENIDVAKYVLSRINKEQIEKLYNIFENILKSLEDILKI